MNRDRMAEMLADAEAELVTAESVVVQLRQVVDGLRGLLSAEPERVSVPLPAVGKPGVMTGQQYPTPTDAVRKVLASHPNRPMDFREIWAKIRAEGWDKHPNYKAYRNASDAAARRASEDPQTNIRKLADGRYVYTTGVFNAPDDAGTPDDLDEEDSSFVLNGTAVTR